MPCTTPEPGARRPIVPTASAIRARVLSMALASAVLAGAFATGSARADGTIIDIDIETADAATLAANLPGIGPIKAGRIVEYRERHGPFGDLDALQAVKGIGPATVERIRAHLADHASVPTPHRAPVAGIGAGNGSRSRSGEPPGGEPRSTTELERATRRAVRDIVLRARRDAAAARASDAR